MPTALNLLVIKSRDIEKLADFYGALGLHFSRHRHANGPEHFAAELDGSVFEIYPLKESDTPTDSVRLGFKVDSLEAAVGELKSRGATLLRSPQNSPWGRRAVMKDIDGHTVELLAAV
jgi:predicted enzyme related to lactoylglutathione lyase